MDQKAYREGVSVRMGKIKLHNTKTLKLTNVLKCKLDLSDEELDFRSQIIKMESFIRSKGALQVGPLIQYIAPYVNDEEEIDMEIILMLQCNNFIHKLEEPYSMEAVIRVTDCMYCRYHGPEEKMKFAYDKIGVEAFENDIELNGENYTIMVVQNEEDETIIADVFMPRRE